jgi:DNA mismatch repair protein MutL
MGKIKLLPDSIANQIAAGEVVGRPSSVIKELVENAIDAGACDIKVGIMDGGKSLIKVIDDGCGMHQDDLQMCLMRHATSKLDENNIHHITSLGFRGEALPSIASVSNLCIISKEKGAEQAWQIVVHGSDEVTGPIVAKGAVGTTVVVEDLFAHVPARLKFLKSDAVERNHIIGVIQDLAMCYPKLSFMLEEGGKTLLHYQSASDSYQRMEQVFGKKFAGNMVSFAYQGQGVQVEGFLGLPTFMQHSGLHQHVFLNGRAVKEKTIYSAIKAAYANTMAHGFFPAVVLYITVDPFEVDVNVHPAKTEVRLRDAGHLRAELIKAIKQGLSGAAIQTSHTVQEAFINRAVTASANKFVGGLAERKFVPSPKIEDSGHTSNDMMKEPPISTFFTSTPPAQQQSIMQLKQEYEVGELGEALCQIGSKYIISCTSEHLVITDQHAAHERIVLENMKHQYDGTVQVQQLLIPVVIDVPQHIVGLIEEHLPQFRDYGFNIARHGINQLLIRTIPSFLAPDDSAEVAKQLVELVAAHQTPELALSKREEIWGNIACHNSVRAGKRMNMVEMNAMLRQIENTPLASQCNHGRPTFVILSLDELDKVFGRS